MPKEETQIVEELGIEAIDESNPESQEKTKGSDDYSWALDGSIIEDEEPDTEEEDIPESEDDDSDEEGSVPDSKPSGDWYDGELQKWANELGFSDTEAQAFGTEENLLRAMSKVLDVKNASQPKQTETQTEEPKKPAKLDIKDFLLPEDGDLDETLVKKFNSGFEKLNEFYSNQLEEAQKVIGSLIQKTQTTEQETARTRAAEFERQYDQVIGSFVQQEKLEGILGKGNPTALDQNSREFAEHRKIVQQYAVLRDGWSNKKGAPSDKDLMIQAAKLVLGDRIKTSERKKLAEKLDKRASQVIGTTSNRTKVVSTKKERQSEADKFIKEKQRAMGLL